MQKPYCAGRHTCFDFDSLAVGGTQVGTRSSWPTARRHPYQQRAFMQVQRHQV